MIVQMMLSMWFYKPVDEKFCGYMQACIQMYTPPTATWLHVYTVGGIFSRILSGGMHKNASETV